MSILSYLTYSTPSHPQYPYHTLAVTALLPGADTCIQKSSSASKTFLFQTHLPTRLPAHTPPSPSRTSL